MTSTDNNSEGTQEKTYAEKYPELIGMKGWLRFLWVWLVFIIPIATALVLIITWTDSDVRRVMSRVDGFLFYSIIETGAFCILAIMSVKAGLKLSSIADDAVLSVKTFIHTLMYVQLGLILLGILLIMGFDEFTRIAPMLFAKQFLNLIGSLLVYLLGWKMYLKHSLRVKATYIDADLA